METSVFMYCTSRNSCRVFDFRVCGQRVFRCITFHFYNSKSGLFTANNFKFRQNVVAGPSSYNIKSRVHKHEYATVVMGQCAACCLHYVICLHHALKACTQTHNFSYESIRFCSILSSTYAISKFWCGNSSSIRKFILNLNQRENAVFDFLQYVDCS